MLTEH